MNAPDKFASLLTLTREPFPASTKSAITGSRPDLRVPVRECCSPTASRSRSTTPRARTPTRPPRSTCDAAWRACAARWIAERGDTESYAGPHAPDARRRRHPRRPRCAAPGRAARRRRRRCSARRAAPRPACNVTPDALRAPRHRHARDGIRGAARERQARMDGASTCPTPRARSGWPATRWARGSRRSSRPSSCATRWRAAARSSPPTSTIPRSSRWRSGATSWSRSTPTSATRP